MNALELDTVLLSPDRTCLEILDQTLLPGEVKTLHLSDMRDIWEAIYSLRVRGAPAIGVCAGYALALAASQIETEDKDVFFARLRETKEYLASARPTAVNLFWALDRVWTAAEHSAGRSVPDICETLFVEAQRIRDEDVAISRAIGELGFSLLRHGDGILTHCNAGTLATAKYARRPRRCTSRWSAAGTIFASIVTRRARFCRAHGSRRWKCTPLVSTQRFSAITPRPA